MIKFKYLLSLLLVCIGCTRGNDTGYLSVESDRFIDSDGRQVVLNGLNHVVKDPKRHYLHSDDEALFKQFKEWGFNCIRFGIIWDGLEPEPGVINEDYLKEIDKRVKWAEDNGLWLILDMHQDLFSRKYADGAPLWATFEDGLPHHTGDVWSDAYLISPAIHRAFDNFWDNKKASDGIGIQDHYISVWKLVAERYADSPAVAGFDVMNEPFMGSAAEDVLLKILEGYGGVLAQKTGKVPSEAELLSILESVDKRIEALDLLNDKLAYKSVMNNALEVVATFEEGDLSDFYQRVRDSIRSVNTNQIIFLEHNYFCNLGVPSTFKFPVDENGNKDLLCAYSPHGYDLVTDTKGASSPGHNRVEAIFETIFESAQKRNVPTIVGEWGAFYMGGEYLVPCEQIISIFEENKAGQTFWAWWPKIETQDYFLTRISRPYPMFVNGELISYENVWDKSLFNCKWEEADDKYNSRIYIPNLSSFDIDKIELSPISEVKLVEIGGNAGYLDISPLGDSRELKIVL